MEPNVAKAAKCIWQWTRWTTCWLCTLHHVKVGLEFIRPGKPMENGYIESFNGKFRDECLNSHWFTSMADARCIIEEWRCDYNEARPHSSLGQLTPSDSAKRNIFFDRISLIAVG